MGKIDIDWKQIRDHANKLREDSRRLSPKIVDKLIDGRSDLKKYSNIPIRIVPSESMEPYDGWHHWDIEHSPHTVEIFLDEKVGGDVLVHELCHADVLAKNLDTYPKMSEEQKEELVRSCEDKIWVK